MMKREVGDKGQVVLPKDIRDHLNIRPGTKVIFEIRGDEIVLRPELPGQDFVAYFCTTSTKRKKRVSLKALKKVIEGEHDLR